MYVLGRKRASLKHWSRQDGSYIGHIARYGAQSADFGCQSGGYDNEGGCPSDFGNFSGIELPCAMGPYWGMANNFDCALRSNAGLTATMLIDWYEYTGEENFLKGTLWRFLAGVADFYSSYAVRIGGRLELYRTCAQEMCQQRRGGGTTHTEDNALPDLAYARMVVMKLKAYAASVGKTVKPQWLELEKDLVDFPLVSRCQRGAANCSAPSVGFAEATSNDTGPEGIPPLGNTDYPIVYFAPVHPAQVVGLESPPHELEHARNTVWSVNTDNQWRPNNGFCLGWPSAGRINGRENGTRVLAAMTDAIGAACFPNFWPNLGGGGLEQAGGIEAIHSMMLQSHESCLRFFSGWPTNGSASFKNLRARGGFLVNASQTTGTINAVSVLSEAGRPLHYCVPQGWKAVEVLSSGKKVSTKVVNSTLRSFVCATVKGAVYTLRPASV
jgi:alpha-L-fucosidase 2